METEFYLPHAFPTQASAVEAAIQAGRQKIDIRKVGVRFTETKELGFRTARFALLTIVSVRISQLVSFFLAE